MAVVVIWGLIGVLASAIGCSPDTVIPKPGSGHCVHSVRFDTSKLGYPHSFDRREGF
jgi:hypothetical protein